MDAPGIRWSLASRERATEIIATLMPPEALGGDRGQIPDFAAQYLTSAPFQIGIALRAMLAVLYWVGPTLFAVGFGNFGSLDQPAREKMLRRIVDSPIYLVRTLGVGLKALSGLAVLGGPAVRSNLGIDPPEAPLAPIGEVRWFEDIRGIGKPTAIVDIRARTHSSEELGEAR